ncbi:hypothetical protein V8E36_005254 [Tilletia maclaganii]
MRPASFALVTLFSTAVLGATTMRPVPPFSRTAAVDLTHELQARQSPPLNVTQSIPYATILNTYINHDLHKPDHRCTRIRQRVEFRSLTTGQRESWIRAHWCMTTRPSVIVGVQNGLSEHRHTSLADDFTLVHIRKFYGIHHVSAFPPWHRYYVHAHELALRGCGYDGPLPYWDWSLDADTGDVLRSPILSNSYGIGGNGTGPLGIVSSGPFAYLPASYINQGDNASIPTYHPHYLTRTFGTAVAPNATFKMFEESYNSSSVARVFRDGADDYITFATLLEGLRNGLDIVTGAPHGGVHVAIGGEMNAPHSPNDPIFFLHHANVDRLWYAWQRGGIDGSTPSPYKVMDAQTLRNRFWAYDGNTEEFLLDPQGGPQANLFDVQTLDGLMLPNIQTYKLMDTTRPPLCYVHVVLSPKLIDLHEQSQCYRTL